MLGVLYDSLALLEAVDLPSLLGSLLACEDFSVRLVSSQGCCFFLEALEGSVCLNLGWLLWL